MQIYSSINHEVISSFTHLSDLWICSNIRKKHKNKIEYVIEYSNQNTKKFYFYLYDSKYSKIKKIAIIVNNLTLISRVIKSS